MGWLMKKRWLVGGAVVAIGAGYLLFHDHDRAAAMTQQARRDGQVALEVHRAAPAPALDPFTPHPAKKFVRPTPVFNPKNGSYEMPLIDAVPDPEGEAREEFGYKAHRLKLGLGDEAGRCYTGGPDGKEEIDISYSMVVENEVLRADNVRVVSNTFSDPGATACILQAVRDMRQLVEKMPNMHEDTEFIISQHDLYVRNHQDDSNAKGHNDDTLTPFDRPTVIPTPPPKP